MSQHGSTRQSVRSTAVDGLYIIESKQVEDERGVVRELFRKSALRDAGVTGFGTWRQINVTESGRGVIRGLHGEDMCKLVSVVAGEGFGVFADVRPGSPTRGVVATAPLGRGIQVLVPRGVCNGFQSTSEGVSQYMYCFDDEWTSGMKGYTIMPLDPDLGIEWPISVSATDHGLISRKDLNAPRFKQVLAT